MVYFKKLLVVYIRRKEIQTMVSELNRKKINMCVDAVVVFLFCFVCLHFSLQEKTREFVVYFR